MIIFLIFGFQVLGPMHKSSTLVVSPGALGGIPSDLILTECVPQWDAAIHWDYIYFADFQILPSNSPPYNMEWDEDMPPNKPAWILTQTDSTGNYIDYTTFCVYFNAVPDSERGWSWNYAEGHPCSTVHFKSVARHEIGHMIGLDDEPGLPPESTIMYPTIDSTRRDIKIDDAKGVCCIYGDVNGASFQQFTIVESPKSDTTVGCYARIIVGACRGYSFSFDSLVVGFYNYHTGKWEKATVKPVKRQMTLNVSTDYTGGHRAKGRICVYWYKNGQIVGSRCTQDFSFRCLISPEPENFRVTLLENGCGECENEVSPFKDGLIFSLFDEIGRPLIKYKGKKR